MLLAIDPSSSRTGWAVGENSVEAAGAIRGKGASYALRVHSMIVTLDSIIDDYDITEAIIELPSGKTHGRLQGKNIQGLPVYGFAVGAIWAMVYLAKPVVTLYTTFDNVWTRGKPKKTRIPIAVDIYPQYVNLRDSGLDICDAICLFDWHLKQKMMEGAK